MKAKLLGSFEHFPNVELHTLDEQSTCYRIRKKANAYTIALIKKAKLAGKLPSGRALAVRAINRQIKEVFAGVIATNEGKRKTKG